MSNDDTPGKAQRPESYWDEGIRALIRGTLHHNLDGTSLHEDRSKGLGPQIVDPGGGPTGARRRRRRARVNVRPPKRKRRKAS